MQLFYFNDLIKMKINLEYIINHMYRKINIDRVIKLD